MRPCKRSIRAYFCFSSLDSSCSHAGVTPGRPVLPTAAGFAVFMAVSANTRYQFLNTFEARALPKLPVAARALTSTVVRTVNNYVGSSNWIWWAKFSGLQKSNDE